MDLTSARKHIERLYFDRCSVFEYQEVTDPETGITGHEEVLVHENVPCKLSHKNVTSTGSGLAASVNLVSTLILAPEINVKAGSKIIVTRNGLSKVYRGSGEPAMHLNHQEIAIELWEDYA